MGTHLAYIAVGSNMGDKLLNCRRAISALTGEGISTLIAGSRFYRTAPVDYQEQDWFVNAAVKVATLLEPPVLFGCLKKIEMDLGRRPSPVRFGPRLIDLDILLYDDLILETSRLTIPHARMHQRRFVLQPVCDIDPLVVHPVLQKTMLDLLEDLKNIDQEVMLLS